MPKQPNIWDILHVFVMNGLFKREQSRMNSSSHVSRLIGKFTFPLLGEYSGLLVECWFLSGRFSLFHFFTFSPFRWRCSWIIHDAKVQHWHCGSRMLGRKFFIFLQKIIRVRSFGHLVIWSKSKTDCQNPPL